MFLMQDGDQDDLCSNRYKKSCVLYISHDNNGQKDMTRRKTKVTLFRNNYQKNYLIERYENVK